MLWDYRFISINADGTSNYSTTTGFGWLILPAIVIVLVIFGVILFTAMLKVYMKVRKVSSDWDSFELLMDKYQLSHEEASIIRRNLRKYRYKNPSDIFKKENEFDKFYKKVMRRPNHHHEILLQMVKKKAFTGHLLTKS
jgi:hypothetical protein